MKVLLYSLILLFSVLGSYGQDKKISFLSLVGNNIQVPRGCEAQSEYELQACNGTSIKWDYYTQDMLDAVYDATITAFAESNSSKSDVTFTSFGAQLKGVKFKMGTTYQYFLQGSIKDQPLMINLGTFIDITKTDDLDGFLSLFFDEAS